MADAAGAAVPIAAPSAGQLGCLILLASVATLWLYAEFLELTTPKSRRAKGAESDDVEGLPLVQHQGSLGKDATLELAGGKILGVDGTKASREGTGGADGGDSVSRAGSSGSSHDAAGGGDGAAGECSRSPGGPQGHGGGATAFVAGSLPATHPPPLSHSAAVRLLRLDRESLLSSRLTLRWASELGAWMLWFYVADRTTLVGAGGKTYVRDQFIFLCLAIFLVAYAYTRRTTISPRTGSLQVITANRGQTEEWKGWMQVLFLLYHYFAAKEIYNAIRICIAGYVWLTGFGNFSYYYRSRDFGLGRFAQMMWRLNFLVVVACLVLRNSYMLYYICPMHTLFTVAVYVTLALGNRFNGGPGSPAGNASGARLFVWAKLAGALALTAIIWEVPGLFDLLWKPLGWLVHYQDPRRPSMRAVPTRGLAEAVAGAATPPPLMIPDPMHEWRFRTSLDRYVWIHGMACAFLHPSYERMLARIEGLDSRAARIRIKSAIALAAAGALVAWYRLVYILPKAEYNRLHPFTSWIPITAFLVLRNITPALRSVNLALFGWLGCITLETYIGQFHTWLLTKVEDGQPVYLLVLLPGYPLLNFTLVSALYIFCSHRLFLATGVLKDALVPHDDNRALARNSLLGAALVGALWAVGFVGRGILDLSA